MSMMTMLAVRLNLTTGPRSIPTCCRRAMEKNTTIYPLKIIFLRQNSSFLTYTLY